MKPTPSQARLLRVLLASILLGAFFLGAGTLVVERYRDVEQAVDELDDQNDSAVYEEAPGCDGLPGVDDCPPADLVDSPTLEGALERYRQGELKEFDAVYLMLTQRDYDEALAPYLGPAVAEIGTSVPESVLWNSSFAGVAKHDAFTWMQQWVLGGDAVLFEQVFVLPEQGDTLVFLENHRNHMAGFGVLPWDGRNLAEGGPVLYRFQDADATTPSRRCVNRALQSVDRMVFAVTLASGGDCSAPVPELPLGILATIVSRAETLLP